MKNIPVLRVDADRDRLSVSHVVSKVRESFRRYDMTEGETTVALYFKDPVRNSYPKVELFARSIEAALPRSIENEIPIILIFQGDIACSVGNCHPPGDGSEKQPADTGRTGPERRRLDRYRCAAWWTNRCFPLRSSRWSSTEIPAARKRCAWTTDHPGSRLPGKSLRLH